MNQAFFDISSACLPASLLEVVVSERSKDRGFFSCLPCWSDASRVWPLTATAGEWGVSPYGAERMIVCVCVWKRERVTAGMMRPRGLTKPLIRTYRANHMSTHNFRNTHTLENKTRANSPNVHIKLEVYVVPPSTTLPHYPPSHIQTLNQSDGLPPSIKCQGLCECDSMMINSLTARVIHHSSRAVSWAVGMMRHETIGTPHH